MAKTKREGFMLRQRRVRGELRQRSAGRPRLSVHRSELNIYAQIIDDGAGRTLVAAASTEKELKSKLKTGATSEAATAVGKALAERAIKAGIKDVVFDRGGYLYHGRVKALASAAREGGLKF
jgi:large subunit ribosomal protein L18